MIYSSNFKINLSLSLLFRREDGFTELESVFYPVANSELCDIVEIVENGGDKLSFSNSGIVVDCPMEKNLCVRAYRSMVESYGVPQGVDIHLHKRIPFGAGLGAGSANATTVLKITNRLFGLGLSDDELERHSAKLGSDTAFFVRERAALATSRGEILSPVDLDLSGYYLALIKPEVNVSTAEAYRLVTPREPEVMPREAIGRPIEEWRGVLKNDFEEPMFRRYPILGELKQLHYDSGALYSAMSGSGSTVFGIYSKFPKIQVRGHFSVILGL
ncbi:MAG: 4-(cytidine 5'-diphospho)-2-C-methyl-D-erythritol kinase [Rikenellaceae bacterium]